MAKAPESQSIQSAYKSWKNANKKSIDPLSEEEKSQAYQAWRDANSRYGVKPQTKKKR